MFSGVILITPYYRLFTEKLYQAYWQLIPLTNIKPNFAFQSEFVEMPADYLEKYGLIWNDPRNVCYFTAMTARIWIEEQEKAKQSVKETTVPMCFMIATHDGGNTDGVVRNDYIEQYYESS